MTEGLNFEIVKKAVDILSNGDFDPNIKKAIETYNNRTKIGPQRAAPKSIAAINAEVQQAKNMVTELLQDLEDSYSDELYKSEKWDVVSDALRTLESGTMNKRNNKE